MTDGVSDDSGGSQLNSLGGCRLNKLPSREAAAAAAVGWPHHAQIKLHLTDFLEETDIISRAHVVLTLPGSPAEEQGTVEAALCAHGIPAALQSCK